MDNDLAHDLTRARELLVTGKSCPYFRPDHNGECTHCDDWADEHGELSEDEQWAVYRLLMTFTIELTAFLALFSDYEAPCESVAQAEAVWNEMKRREEIEREEMRRLRKLVTAYFGNHCANADAEGMSVLCECALCVEAKRVLQG